LGIFDRLKQGLSKTREGIAGKIEQLVARDGKLDDDFYDELEEILLQADVGVDTTWYLLDTLRQRVKKERLSNAIEARAVLEEEITLLLGGHPVPLNRAVDGCTVVMVVGVNGAGKTTTIGKLASLDQKDGRKVILAAADTFRAAAIEQLEIWGRRAGSEVIKQQEGSDPAAVVYDAVLAARSRRADLLYVDTAGRLQNKKNLMNELEKVKRVLGRELPGAPHEVLLVLDATTGQNAVSQAKTFNETVNLTGIVLTKLDGTAKGGVILAIRYLLPEIPIKFVGVGEGLEDLQQFDPGAFARALFGKEE